MAKPFIGFCKISVRKKLIKFVIKKKFWVFIFQYNDTTHAS